MTTALARKTDSPLSTRAMVDAYKAGRTAAEIEAQLYANMINGEDFDHRLNQKLQRILWGELTYRPLQGALYGRAHAARKQELAPGLAQLEENARPYWETHDTMIVQHAPNLMEIVVLGPIPIEMIKGMPYSSGEVVEIPRKENFQI